MVTALAMALGGCAVTPGPSTSLPVVVETPSPDEAESVRFRQDFGLRADVAYVRAVAADPRASTDDFAVPLLPAEVAELNARAANADAIREAVQTYARAHRDEFGGMYFNQESGGGALTTLWTAHLAEHEAAIRSLIRPDARVAFRTATFTEGELEALQERISADLDWLLPLAIAPQGVAVDVVHNTVELLVSSADPLAPAIVSAHYAGRPGMLTVISDGTGEALIPIATVRGIVVAATGDAPGDNTYQVVTRGPGPGRCGGDIDEMGHGVGPDGRFEIHCAAGTWTIAVQDAPIAGPNGIDLGLIDVIVPDGGVINVIITLDPAP